MLAKLLVRTPVGIPVEVPENGKSVLVLLVVFVSNAELLPDDVGAAEGNPVEILEDVSTVPPLPVLFV